jgi:hypothetical protein
MSGEMKETHHIEVTKEEWDQLVSLAQELASDDFSPSPQQVGRALLRKALVELLQGKQLLKAAIQEQTLKTNK